MPNTLMEQAIFRRLLRLSIGFPLIFMAFLAFVLFAQVNRQVKASGWVEHSDQVIAQAHETLDALLELETAQRGFLISGKPLFLQAYNRAVPSFPSNLAALQRMVADNPAQ